MITLSERVTGFHHGQLDVSILAHQEDRIVGFLDYSVYDNIPKISMIKVEHARRQGIASKMLVALQSAYPDSAIDWGTLTKDGACLYKATPMIKRPTRHHHDFARLERIEERCRKMILSLEEGSLSPKNHAKIERGLMWLTHRKEELQDSLWGKAPYSLLINTALLSSKFEESAP